MVLNKKNNTTRLSSLDILRGLGVLLMVEAFIAIKIPFVSDMALIFTAPIFLFVAGASFQLLLRNRKARGNSGQEIFQEVFWRAVALFLVTSIITLVFILVFGTVYSGFSTIFIIISTGLLVGFLVRRSFKRQVLAIFIILALDLVIRAYQVPVLSFLTGNNLGLSILPYLCFFIFGMMAYRAYKSDNFKRYDNQILLVYGILFFFLNLALYLAFPYPFTSEYRNYPPLVLMVASLIILLFLLLVRVVDLDGNIRWWLTPIENLGRISLTSYYLSYLSFLVLGSLFLEESHIYNVLIFLLTSLGLVLLERLLRPGYRYGLEWWYRRLSARALLWSTDK